MPYTDMNTRKYEINYLVIDHILIKSEHRNKTKSTTLSVIIGIEENI